ncbi:MAG: FtsX-like permease family protein, partial [Eubacteriales bacterium]|nr:FtsX-like permease family protein [Eubacteriales bacterium]
YVMLAIGIVLAIYFIATALLFGFGIYTSLEERQLNRYGKQDAILFDCGGAPLDDLVAEGTLSVVGKAEVLGEAVTGDSQASLFSIAGYDDTALALSRHRLKQGEYPDQAGEIALEQSALAQLRQDARVGDTVTLTLRIPDGNGGFLGDTVEKTYTLTGILYDQLIYWDFFMFDSVYHDIPAGLVSEDEPVESGSRAVTMAYCALAQGNASMPALDAFCEAHGITDTLAGSYFSSDDAMYDMIFTGGFAVLVGLVLVVACCLGIVNAFSTNLDARRRQIGLLRAVGATRKQIKQVFGRETMILSLIAIPVGLALAVLSVFGIFSWLGEDYVLILSPWVLLGVAALGVLCVMLASRIPLRRASAVSPMQAIRDVDLMRRVRQKTIRSRTTFAAPRLIATRSGRIYRRKRAGISAAMAAGILVFTLAALFVVTMTTQIASYTYENDYTLYGGYAYWDTVSYGFHDPGLTEQDKQDVMALPLVDTVLGEKTVQIKLLPEEITSYATGDGWQDRFAYLSADNPSGLKWFGEGTYDEYVEIRNRYYSGSDYLSVSAIAVEESLIEQLSSCVYEGSIDLDKLRSGEEVLLVAPQEYELYFAGDEYGSTLSEYQEEGLTLVTSQTNDMFHAGDTLAISLLYSDEAQQYDEAGEVFPEDIVRIDKTATIGAVLDISREDYERLDMRSYPSFLDVVTTLPGLAALGFDTPYIYLSVRLSEMPDAQTEAYLNDALEQIVARVSGVSFSSSLETAHSNRRMAAQMAVLGAALSILMFAIVASMMNNSLSAHIRAGRRSIGTLRAVGMDSRDIFRSYFYQMIPMFAWGGGIGLALSLLTGYFLTQTGALVFTDQPLPVWQPLVFAALLLFACAWNIRTRLRGILRESITENIREL